MGGVVDALSRKRNWSWVCLFIFDITNTQLSFSFLKKNYSNVINRYFRDMNLTYNVPN